MNSELKHIAFIMDGNGRYATKHNQPRTFGHNEGAKRIPEIILECVDNQIPYISFFAFSTENWNRPKSEVNYLMNLLQKQFSTKNQDWFKQHQINLNVIGFKKNLPKNLLSKIEAFEKAVNTKKYPTQVNIFFNYGSRAELVHAINEAIKEGKAITEKSFAKFLLTKKLPDVDLLIRTSGEHRVSNFLLWQIAYSEMIFEPTLWPEYTPQVLKANLKEYNTRDRRFGRINEK